MFWQISTTIAVIALTYSFLKKRNAIWGGLTIGLFIGMIIALTTDFNWTLVGKYTIIGTLFGLGAELLGLIADKLRRG